MTDKEFHAINLCVARCIIVEGGGTGEIVDEIMAPLDRLRSQLSALREALDNAAWAALGASAHTPLQDPDPKNEVGSGYGKAYNHGAYQAALSVHRHVTAALASTEPGGEGRKP